ncbi:MAG: L-threonylcarbamoyladenylate synthase [Candidatus Roizmanbacteria bacterium]
MKLLLQSENSLQEIVKMLEAGELVIIPSDTVYGLIADATNKGAIEKLYRFKERVAGKPVSVFVDSFEMLEQHVLINRSQGELLRRLLPGPYTVVLPSKHNLVKDIESESGTLGIRIPKYPLIHEIVSTLGKPVTATSANKAGSPPHHSFSSLMNHISKKNQELISLAIDAGNLPHNRPSTVLDLTEPDVKILRKGDEDFTQKKSYVSKYAKDTRDCAKIIYLDIFPSLPKDKALVFILEGDLGAGKTEFTKGIGELFSINNIVSPTFTIYYEYTIPSHERFTTLIHADLYNIREENEFEPLGFDRLLKPNSIWCIEWGEKSGALKSLFEKKSLTVYITIRYITETEREFVVQW